MTYINHNNSVFSDKAPLGTNVEKGSVAGSMLQMEHSLIMASLGPSALPACSLAVSWNLFILSCGFGGQRNKGGQTQGGLLLS